MLDLMERSLGSLRQISWISWRDLLDLLERTLGLPRLFVMVETGGIWVNSGPAGPASALALSGNHCLEVSKFLSTTQIWHSTTPSNLLVFKSLVFRPQEMLLPVSIFICYKKREISSKGCVIATDTETQIKINPQHIGESYHHCQPFIDCSQRHLVQKRFREGSQKDPVSHSRQLSESAWPIDMPRQLGFHPSSTGHSSTYIHASLTDSASSLKNVAPG